MRKTLRLFAGVVLIGLLFTAAWMATRGCTVALYVYDNCWWVWTREQLGLPANKFLRAAFLELVGLAILAGLYLTVQYVLLGRGRRADTSTEAGAARGPEPRQH